MRIQSQEKEDKKRLRTERYKCCTRQVECRDDPVEFGNLICAMSVYVFQNCSLVESVFLLKSMAIKGRALATLKFHVSFKLLIPRNRFIGSSGAQKRTW